jgi:hypothetical protein
VQGESLFGKIQAMLNLGTYWKEVQEESLFGKIQAMFLHHDVCLRTWCTNGGLMYIDQYVCACHAGMRTHTEDSYIGI